MENTENQIKLYFTVTADFTAVSGPMKLTLKAVNSNDNTCIIFTGDEVEVTGNSNEDCLPAEIGEQLLRQIEQAIADFESQLEGVAEQKVSEAIEDILSGNLVTSTSVTSLVALTQSGFDAIPTPDEKTMYVIIN